MRCLALERCLLALGTVVLFAPWAQASAPRPPPEAACRAMDAHISELIIQHTHAADLDEATFDAIAVMFHDAQRACNFKKFEEALLLYTSIPIGPVQNSWLR